MLNFLLVLVLLLSGCGQIKAPVRGEYAVPEDVEVVEDIEVGKYGGIFVTAIPQGPKTFNPLNVTDLYSLRTVERFSGNIVNYDPLNDSAVPSLAKSWEISKDKKTYRFKLRQGILWSDGEPFSVDDVIFTLDAIFDKRYPNRMTDELTVDGEPIGYKKIDKYTLEVSTKKPSAPMLLAMTFWILPKHKLLKAYEDGSLLKVWTLETAINHPEELVGLGPFKIKSFVPGERLVFEPNPHYWRVDKAGKRLPYINYLIQKYVPDTNTGMVLFATGQLDAAELASRDLPWIRKAAEKYHFNIYERGPSDSIGFFWFNMKPGKNEKGEYYVKPYKLKWFNNKVFRQAISYAIDREGIIKSLLLGQGTPLYSYMGPGRKKWFNPNTKKYLYDPERARKMLVADGFSYNSDRKLVDKDGNAVKFEYMSTEAGAGEIDPTIKENLDAIGIEMNLIYVDFGTLMDRTSNTFSYEACTMGLGGGAPDPSSSKAIILSSGRMHIWNPEQKSPATKWELRLDRLFMAQDSEFDEKRRIELVHKIDEIFAEQMPLVFLITPNSFVGIKQCWSNLKIPSSGLATWNIDEIYTCNPNNFYR